MDLQKEKLIYDVDTNPFRKMFFGNIAPSSSGYPENSIDWTAKTPRKMGHSAGIDWLAPYISRGLEIYGCAGDGLACVLFWGGGFVLFIYWKQLESLGYSPLSSAYFPFAFTAFGNQTSVSIWVIDSCSFIAKLCVFTRDAVNGLINCYKELLDLVKSEKKKNHC